MSIPLRIQLIDAFSGSQQGIHSIIMPDIFSSGGSINVYMDRYARVRRILGFSAQGAAVTTNTGGSATRIRNLFPYRDTTGAGAFVRQLIGTFDDATDEYELWYSTDEGVSWNFISETVWSRRASGTARRSARRDRHNWQLRRRQPMARASCSVPIA